MMTVVNLAIFNQEWTFILICVPIETRRIVTSHFSCPMLLQVNKGAKFWWQKCISSNEWDEIKAQLEPLFTQRHCLLCLKIVLRLVSWSCIHQCSIGRSRCKIHREGLEWTVSRFRAHTHRDLYAFTCMGNLDVYKLPSRFPWAQMSWSSCLVNP